MFLLIVNIIVGLLFLALGLFTNEKNFSSLISTRDGKSTSKESITKLPDLVRFFKQFHIFLGSSTILLSLLLKMFYGQDALGMLLAFYPILAYIYFIIRAKPHYSPNEKLVMNIALWALIITGIGIGALLFTGYKKSELVFMQTQIKITGMYGQTIRYSDISILKLEENIPPISMKTNGYALQSIKKGYFKLKNGEKVKLILNSLSTPIIFMELRNGKKIYYSDTKENNRKLFDELNARRKGSTGTE